MFVFECVNLITQKRAIAREMAHIFYATMNGT